MSWTTHFARLATAMAAFSSVLPEATATVLIPSKNATAACNKLKSSTSMETDLYYTGLLNPNYMYAKTHYWSAANGDLNPACVVFPVTTADVSTIVRTLLNYPDVPFAVKGGGHNPNVGFSSTDGGILIAMSKIANTTFNAAAETASIGPGARWGEVMTALEPYNRAVVGGRLGDVGVAGLLLGGGLSFLSSQYGLACDGVVNYELVLANATITNANATYNPDLYWSLKGGGNQFAIVTKFTLKTHSIGQVWGGLKTYTLDKAGALINATADLASNYHDPKAAVIVTGEVLALNLVEIFVVFFFYDGTAPPAGVFDKFDAIPALSDTTKIQSYASLLNGNDATNIYGMRYFIRGTTLPNLPDEDGRDLYNYHYQTWRSYVMSKAPVAPDFIFSMAFQPLPAIISEHSAAAGGNALSIDPSKGDKMWMEYDASWSTVLGDNSAHLYGMEITNEIDTYARTVYGDVTPTHAQAASPEMFLPVFMNDAMYDQKPLQSYGAPAVAKLKAVKQAVDPKGFFGRTGGFRLE